MEPSRRDVAFKARLRAFARLSVCSCRPKLAVFAVRLALLGSRRPRLQRFFRADRVRPWLPAMKKVAFIRLTHENGKEMPATHSFGHYAGCPLGKDQLWAVGQVHLPPLGDGTQFRLPSRRF